MIQQVTVWRIRPPVADDGLVTVAHIVAENEAELDNVGFKVAWRGRVRQTKKGLWKMTVRTLPRWWKKLSREICLRWPGMAYPLEKELRKW